MAKRRGRPRKVTEESTENVESMDSTETNETEDNFKKVDEVVDEVVEEVKPSASDSDVVGEGTFNDYNPFGESVVEREYATPKVASGVTEEISEPTFVPPSYEDIVAEREGGGMVEDLSENPFDNPNPALNDLDNKDKKIACESLVDTCLDAYEQLHKYAQYVVKVDEDELMQKQASGKIDLNEIIPVTENGDTMSVGEFIGQYNQQSADALKYDKEFGYKVRPAMVRVFMKKGWGMSDEQYLLYMFGKDIAVKVGIMYSLKKTINSTLSTLEKAHKRKQQESKGYTQVFEEEKPSVVMDDEPILQTEEVNVPQEEIIIEQPEVVMQEENFTSNMNINMPQNPKDPMAEHPQEIRSELKKERRKRKK